MNTDRIAKLSPRETPEAKHIIQEVRDALINAQSLGVYDKIDRAHMTRRCLAPGQSPDGLKHGDDALPWQGAIDSRVRLVEEIITDHVRIRMAAVRAGSVQIGPMNEVEDSPKATLWNDVLKYYTTHGLVRKSLRNANKLFFTCIEELGYGILKVGWWEKKTLKPIKLTLSQVVSFRAQEMLTEMVSSAGLPPEEAAPPEWQTEAANAATADVEELFTVSEMKDACIQLLQRIDPTMPTSEATRVRTQFTKGQAATYYAPRGEGGLPCVSARIPWVNCLHSLDLDSEGEASWYADVEWLSEYDLRRKCAMEEVNPKWLEEVLKQPNKGLSEVGSSLPGWVLNGVGLGLQPDNMAMQKSPMFQVLTVYRKAVNEAGIPACYETLVHPMVQNLLGKHECCEVDELPFITEMREPAAIAVQSRGVPELSMTDQIALKKLKDATLAAAELAGFPPYERAMGDNNRIAPGVELAAKRTTGTAGTASKFLDVPGVDMGALKAMEMTRLDSDRLWVRGAVQDPDARRLYLEDLGESAVLSYESIIRMIWLHIQAYVENLTASRIAGRAVNIKASAEDLEGTADIHVQFSALALNQKTALDLAEYGTKIAGLDREGRIDFGAFVETITRVFDPTLSENIIMPGEQATAQIEKDEQAVIAAITSGQYVTGRVNSPGVRMKVLQQWLSNPQTVAMLQANPMMYQAVQQHMAGLSQEQVQKGQNVFIGQTGQKPTAPWEEQQEPAQMLQAAVEGQSVAA